MKLHECSASSWLLRISLAVLTLIAAPAMLSSQEPPPPQPPPPPPTAGPLVTVSGSVLNSATGQPLPRALVELSGIPGLGILTNGDGRFQIPGVPSGDQTLLVNKPGFRDPKSEEDERANASHSVMVTAGMPDLVFSLAPMGAIYGRVSLSTGIPAEGIGLSLLRQTIDHGRAGWEAPENHKATPDGIFRFPSLRDGTYLVETDPEFENIDAKKPLCNADAPAEMAGFAAEFPNGIREVASASKIGLAQGQNLEVNLMLLETKFHLVRARLLAAPEGKDWSFSQTLLDQAGREVPYALSEEKDHTLCAYLPDGSYTLVVAATSVKERQSPSRVSSPDGDRAVPPGNKESNDLIGTVDFSVDGEAVRNLRVPLAYAALTSVHLRYEPGPPSKAAPKGDKEELPYEDSDQLVFSGTRANAFGQSSNSTLSASQVNVSSYQMDPAVPGAYWIHASASAEGVCLGSVSAAGQDLALVPWTAGPSGSGTPIDVVMRTDCASLTVEMPATLVAEAGGEVATWYVYAIPQFNTVDDLSRVEIGQSSDHVATFKDLAPGNYRIFAFTAPRTIEFHSPAALDRLGQGQAVTLQPRENAKLQLEALSR